MIEHRTLDTAMEHSASHIEDRFIGILGRVAIVVALFVQVLLNSGKL